MNIVEKFSIDLDTCIKIIVPDFKNKFNYYYEPTEALHKFDEVSVVLTVNTSNTTIMLDIVQMVVWPLYGFLRRAVHNKIPLPHLVELGTVSGRYNREHYKDYWQDEKLPSAFTIDYHQFWLWSSPTKIQSWMYNRDGKIYLEIGESYNPDQNNSNIPDDRAFEEYMASYKPLLFAEICRDVAEEWIKKCEKLIHDIDDAYDLD